MNEIRLPKIVLYRKVKKKKRPDKAMLQSFLLTLSDSW